MDYPAERRVARGEEKRSVIAIVFTLGIVVDQELAEALREIDR